MKYIITPLIFLVALTFSANGLAREKQHQSIPNNTVEMVYETIEIQHVIDGDTFVANNERIRLWGINAPEKNKPLYDMSTFALEKFLGNKVRCKHIEMDKYKRRVMQCKTIDGIDIGAMMVWTGFARDFQKYSGGFYNSEEKWAKGQKLGIWKE